MFPRNTVFIVGAGGSQEVGLPTGDALKGEIAHRLNVRYNDGGDYLSSGDKGVAQALSEHCRNGPRGMAQRYQAAGWAIAEAMPQAISIDNYLHTHAHDEAVVFMGKLGIASSILAAER